MPRMHPAQWIAAMLCWLCLASAHAVPKLEWTAEMDARGFAYLSRKLENTVVQMPADGAMGHAQAFGAKAWEWEAARFKPAQQQPLTFLYEGQRWVARAQLVFPASSPASATAKGAELGAIVSAEYGPDLYLLWPLHRLDYLHLSYRVNQGAWHTLSAGDRIPMNQWAYKNPFPAFALPQAIGTIDVVLEAVHTGVISDKVLLATRPEYRLQHFSYGLVYGTIIGLSLAMAAIALAMAFAFKRKRFAAVAVLSLCSGLAMSVTSGIAGMYLFTGSAQWNDESKMSLLLLAAAMPWALGIVLGYTRRSQVLWWVSNLWLALVLCTTGLGWVLELHTQRLGMLVTVWVCSVVLTVAIAAAAVLGDDPRSKPIVATTAMGVVSLLFSVSSYTGLGQAIVMLVLGAASMVLTLLGMLFVIYLQYRHGRSVLASERTGIGRDPLTGLRNSSGFEQSLALNTLRTAHDSGQTAFFWIQLAPADALRGHYGDEGFEHGLVRIAAVLASCVDQKSDLARPEDNAFCAAVAMDYSPEQARALATMMLSRTLALSPDSEALTQYMRIALAWAPTHGRNLAELKSRCQKALLATPPEKKIVALSMNRH